MTSSAFLASIVVASLLGSLHCAAMCGGFAAFYAGSAGPRRRASHLAYHGGRLLVYAALGALAGGLGAALDVAGRAAGLGRVAGVLAGVLMIGWGGLRLLELRGVSLGRGLRAPNFYGRLVRHLAPRPRASLTARAGLLGLASALLPCGWLYAFVVAAAGTGSAWLGAATLIAFWSGTVPMLLGVAVGAGLLSQQVRRHLPFVSALALVVLGLWNVLGRVNLPVTVARHATSGVSSSSVASPPCH